MSPKPKQCLNQSRTAEVLLVQALASGLSPCADPESFVRGGVGQRFFKLMREGGSKYNYEWAIIGPPEKRDSMAFRWRADDGPTLNAGLVALRFFGGYGPLLLEDHIFL